MRSFLYTLLAAIILISCSSDEHDNYVKKKNFFDSMCVIAAERHKAKIKPLLELVRNDSILWDDTLCRISDSSRSQLSFMVYYILEFKSKPEYMGSVSNPASQLDVLQNIRDISTIGYNKAWADGLRELGGWVDINKHNKSPYIIFIQTYDAAMPKQDRSRGGFKAGYFTGRALVMNYETGQRMCAFDLYAQSSDTVSYTYNSNNYYEGAEYKLSKDLIANIGKEIRAQLVSITGVSDIKIAGCDRLDEFNRLQ